MVSLGGSVLLPNVFFINDTGSRIKCTLSNAPEGQNDMQRDLGKLSKGDLMRFNNGKVPMGQGNPTCQHRLGDEQIWG